MPICTSAYRTLHADDYPLYDSAMGGLGILDVPETVEDLAGANASEIGPILAMNGSYVPASVVPSFMLPELSLEDIRLSVKE